MQKRKLGNLEVSALGFGCMSISANYRPAADVTRVCLLNRKKTTSSTLSRGIGTHLFRDGELHKSFMT